MMKEKTPGSGVYKAHYLQTCRLDNWIRLLHQNNWRIAKEKRKDFWFNFGMSAVTSIVAALEMLIFAIPIHTHKIKKDPVFILGHWRSGTTYLVNLMSRDSQFGWCDPVSTTTFNISYLLGWYAAKVQQKVLVAARPMDNMQYTLDTPMEDIFALNLISTQSIIHMLPFPKNYPYYLRQAFTDELPEKDRKKWKRSFSYVLKKISLRKGGRQMLLKSPDHTLHPEILLETYPGAKYVNIHRDPYTTIRSTINMFKKEMDVLRLGELPEEDMDDLLERMLVDVFARVYEKLFRLQDAGAWAPGTFVDVAYADLEKAPEACLKHIYDTLALDGYAQALPKFKEHIDSQKGYVKNKFTISPRLRDRVNARLGFYFERYGYTMLTD